MEAPHRFFPSLSSPNAKTNREGERGRMDKRWHFFPSKERSWIVTRLSTVKLSIINSKQAVGLPWTDSETIRRFPWETWLCCSPGFDGNPSAPRKQKSRKVALTVVTVNRNLFQYFTGLGQITTTSLNNKIQEPAN